MSLRMYVKISEDVVKFYDNLASRYSMSRNQLINMILIQKEKNVVDLFPELKEEFNLEK